MKKMFHPNIVQLYEIIDDPSDNKLYLIMQYISGGNLLEKIKLLEKVPEDLCWRWFRELVAGLEYCHEVAGIIHRDIKPENLLIDEAGHLYLSDFGISFMIENGSDESRATFGSSYFMAPEICQGSKYKGRQTDIWAAGVTLFYMLAGELPFKGCNMATLHQAIINKNPEFPSHWDSDLVDLLKGMLTKKAEDRFTLDQVKTSSWITQKGIQPIINCIASRIEVNEEDKSLAIYSLKYSMAMARIKSVFKKTLWRARARIAAKKASKV